MKNIFQRHIVRIAVYLYDKNQNEIYLKAANFQIRDQLSFPVDDGLISRPFESGNILIAEDINYDDFPVDQKRFKKLSKLFLSREIKS